MSERTATAPGRDPHRQRFSGQLFPWPVPQEGPGHADASTIVIPAILDPGFGFEPDEPGYQLQPTTEPGWSATRSRRRTRISRGVLLCLLLIQALLSLRLTNTAFQDEALYLFAGRATLDHLLHGTVLSGGFASYFSGAPMMYPVLAAAVHAVAGLAGVKALSLVFMLSTTTLLYSFTRLLFNERAGLCAAGGFAFAESTLFMGNFATYDAMALFLLAATTWIVVRTGPRHATLCLLAAPVAVLAVFTKYAAALYLPTITIILVLTAYERYGIGRALLRATLFTAVTTGLLAGTFYATKLLTGVQSTTTNRQHGTTSAMTIALHSVEWGGLVFVLACLGTVMYARRGGMSEMPGWRHPIPGARWRLAIGFTLTGTALLAPAYQTYLGTEISLHKHIGFGLLFAAPIAGVGVTRLMGAHFKFPQVTIVVGVVAMTMGMSQSAYLFGVWPDSTRLISYLEHEVKPDGHYLADSFEVPVYYLGRRTTPQQWTSTDTITYTDHGGKVTTGLAGYQTAVQEQYFDLVVLDSAMRSEAGVLVRKEMQAGGHYRLLASLPYTTVYGAGNYEVWAKS